MRHQPRIKVELRGLENQRTARYRGFESPPLRSYSDKKDLRHLARVLFFMRGTADAAEGQQAFRMPSRFCKPPESSLVVRFIAAKNELDFKLNSEY